jgi:hypothetical protein
MAYCNWDVEELKAREADIEGSSMLTITLEGMSSFKYIYEVKANGTREK